MKQFRGFPIVLFVLPFITHCQVPPPVAPQLPSASSRPVGGGCDGCELMYIGMPASTSPVDTSAGFNGPGQQLLVRGNVYLRDGKTPAQGVVLYYWQTDHTGFYSPEPGGDAGARRHGRLRGWMETGADGGYALYTIRPAPYPGQAEPAHIHISIKEPGIPNEYYIDDLLFDDDPLLTTTRRQSLEQRGGNGIMEVRKEGGLQLATRDIVLGLNIPGHPDRKKE